MELQWHWLLISFCLLHACSRVVGIEKKYVAQGELVVLTCPHRSENFKTTWLGPPNFVQYGDGSTINDRLEKRDRLRIVGNFSIGEFRLEILNFSSVDEGFYRCTVIVNKRALQYDIHMALANAPSVNITLVKLVDQLNLTCLAEGLPNSYIFSEWEHKSFFGEHIRYLNGSSNGVLILPVNGSIGVINDNNGVYICGVNNGIKRSGKLIQKAYTDVRLEDKPVFVTDNVKVQYGSLGKSTTITTYIYSYPKHTVFCCQTQKWKMCQHTHPFVFKEENAVIRDIRHGVEVLVHGCKIIYTTTVLKPSDFDLYTFEAKNGLGSDKLFVELRFEGNAPNLNDDSFNTTTKIIDTKVDYMPYVIAAATFVVILILSNVLNCYIQTQRHQSKQNNELCNSPDPIDDTTRDYFEIDPELEIPLEEDTHISLISFNCIAETSGNRANNLETSTINSSNDSKSSSTDNSECSLSNAISQFMETEYETLEPEAQSRNDHTYLECIAQYVHAQVIESARPNMIDPALTNCDIPSSHNQTLIEYDVSSAANPAITSYDTRSTMDPSFKNCVAHIRIDQTSMEVDTLSRADPAFMVYDTQGKRDPAFTARDSEGCQDRPNRACEQISRTDPASTLYDPPSSQDHVSTVYDTSSRETYFKASD